MNVLIMYSGGVESTALIQHAIKQKVDYTLVHVTHNNSSKNEMASCIDSVYEVVINKPAFDAKFTNPHADISLWLSTAMQVVGRGNFDQVWFGAHSHDNLTKVPIMQSTFRHMMRILRIDCKLKAPLMNMDKYDQYHMLTFEQKQSIVSCKNGINNEQCGQCGKCQEFERYVLRYLGN